MKTRVIWKWPVAAAAVAVMQVQGADMRESPHTPEKGRFLMEMEIASFTVDGGDKSYDFGEGSAATSEQYFNTGLTWDASDAVQLYGGVRVGLSNDAWDFSPFLGISVEL